MKDRPRRVERLMADVDASDVKGGAFWWLGQQSYIAKLGRTVLYVDPFLSQHKARQIPPFFAPSAVKNADLILGTHDHLDHIDRAVWPELGEASKNASFVVPAALLPGLARDLGLPGGRFIGLNDGTSVRHRGVKITGIAAAHELLAPDRHGRHPCLSYVVEGNGVCLFFGGDMCVYDGLKAKLSKWKFDAMFLPINGRDALRYRGGCIGNMTFQEAVDLAGALKPRLAVPAHYDMFAGNSEDPQKFVDYLKVKYPSVKSLVCRRGERVVVRT